MAIFNSYVKLPEGIYPLLKTSGLLALMGLDFFDPLPFVQGPKKAEVSTTSTVGHGHKSLRGETTVPFKGLKFYRTIVASPQKKGVFPS